MSTQTAATLGLRTSWAKTKLQNLGSGPSPTSLQTDGNGVESVDSFVYLGSLQKSEDNSRPDMKRRISLAASVMSSLSRIWRDKILQLSTKIRLYQALVMSVFLYAAETWTLLSCDEKTLEAFHMKCQGQILHKHWSQHVTNADITARTGLPPVMDFIRRRRLSVFGYAARLTQGTPAHNALHCQVGLASGRSLSGTGDVVLVVLVRAGQTNSATTTGSVPANLWRQAILRGHSGATRRPELATRWRQRRRHCDVLQLLPLVLYFVWSHSVLSHSSKANRIIFKEAIQSSILDKLKDEPIVTTFKSHSNQHDNVRMT